MTPCNRERFRDRSDPAIRRIRRVSPGAHLLIAGIRVRVESEKAAAFGFLRERRLLTGDGGGRLGYFRAEVCGGVHGSG